jgi:hypothetical protein
MLSIHLFNLVGYILVFRYLMDRSDAGLVRRIDDGDYSRSGLTLIKTAFSLPYLTGSDKFERVDGEIVIGGTYYRYVERKFYNDTLYLVCLPNQGKTELSQVRNQFEHNVNSFPGGEKKIPGTEIKKGLFGAEGQQPVQQDALPGASSVMIQVPGRQASRPAAVFLPSVYSPPDQA